jgi:hypothetical protein
VPQGILSRSPTQSKRPNQTTCETAKSSERGSTDPPSFANSIRGGVQNNCGHTVLSGQFDGHRAGAEIGESGAGLEPPPGSLNHGRCNVESGQHRLQHCRPPVPTAKTQQIKACAAVKTNGPQVAHLVMSSSYSMRNRTREPAVYTMLTQRDNRNKMHV